MPKFPARGAMHLEFGGETFVAKLRLGEIERWEAKFTVNPAVPASIFDFGDGNPSLAQSAAAVQLGLEGAGMTDAEASQLVEKMAETDVHAVVINARAIVGAALYPDQVLEVMEAEAAELAAKEGKKKPAGKSSAA